jgi:hypothetical protein
MSAEQDVTPRGLRFVFVQMLFALTVGETARQIATLIDQTGVSAEAASSYSHLLLATIIVATSWVGWTRSISSLNMLPLLTIFSLPFLVLLIDVSLVIFYFIIVKGVEMPMADTYIVTPSAKNETFWVLIIFMVYFLWDFLTKAVAQDIQTNTGESRAETKSHRTFRERFFSLEFWKRGGITFICAGIALLLWYLLRDASSRSSVVLADLSLLSLVLLFRALKQRTLNWTIITVIALIISTYLAVKYPSFY